LMTQILLAMMVASRTSWVTSTVVMPSSLQTWRMSSCILDLVKASRAPRGLSKSRSWGEDRRTLAKAALCRCPPGQGARVGVSVFFQAHPG
jgi:hypothetical protein